ncbi:hypothetical protein [Sphingobacterium multivorum]|uniref:Lipoprotein n=1 Tax=Sphingobacterium multivorum TaxID=28454 RepID=A0A654D4S6_SPHMU|nr:hypothetical protein [Sphingobacterium multivorum]VXC99532.1 hypothetical protein SPHINGO8BC_51471 [Sphingobacterium multivorum]
MKIISKILLAIAVLALLSLAFSCGERKNEVKTFVVLGKKATDGGMCHSEGKFTFEHVIVIVPHVTTPPPHRHRKVDPEYLLLVANEEGSIKIHVSKQTFDKIKLYNRIRYDMTDNKILSINSNQNYVIEIGTTTL